MTAALPPLIAKALANAGDLVHKLGHAPYFA